MGKKKFWNIKDDIVHLSALLIFIWTPSSIAACILTLQYHSQTFNLKPNPTPSPSTAVKPGSNINLNQTKPSYPNPNQAILTLTKLS